MLPASWRRLSHLYPVSRLIPYSLHSLLTVSSFLLARITNSILWSITVSLFQGIYVLLLENHITSETVRDVLITNCQISHDTVHTEGRPYRGDLLAPLDWSVSTGKHRDRWGTALIKLAQTNKDTIRCRAWSFGKVERNGMRLRPGSLIITAICGVLVPHTVLAGRGWSGWQAPKQQVSVGEWFTFSPPNAPFSVTLPAMPTGKSIDRASRIKVRTYGLKALKSEYLVLWASGLPKASSDHMSLDSFFPLALKQMMELADASGARFDEQYEKELNLAGNCGREAKMRTWPPNSHDLWSRGYIVGSDLVALVVRYPEEEEASAEAARFFDSLTLLKTGKESVVVDGSGQSSYRATEGASSLDSDPIPLSLPRPGYTESARAYKVQGLIKLRVFVNREGDVREVWLR